MLPEKLQKAIHTLLTKEPYFAHYILNSKVIMDKFNVPTAGVASIRGVPTFIFNSKWIERFSVSQISEIVKHEVLHTSLGHILDDTKRDKTTLNIAMDCAINQYLKEIPANCVTLGSLSKALKKPLLAFQTSEYYYDQMMSSERFQKSPGSAGGTLDEHNLEIDGMDTREIARAVMGGVANKAAVLAAGNVPEAILRALDATGQSIIPWKRVLRNFVFSSVSSKRIGTTKKINRRFALPIPGVKRERQITLAVCIDESGSMSDEQLQKVVSELQAINKQITKTFILHADCEVAHIEEMKKGKPFKFERRSNGGTAYQPAITKAVELGADCIIYFGDFDCADTPVDPKKPFLWVGVTSQEAPAAFGQVLRLT